MTNHQAATGDSGSSRVPSTNHHYHHHDPLLLPPPLCELRIADSIFFGFVTSHSTLEAIQQCRRNLIDQFDRHHRHPKASSCHAPYAASTTVALLGNDDDDVDDIAKPPLDRIENYDDDNEPPASQIGKTLLGELRRYRQRLTRQATFRMSGSNNNGSNCRRRTSSHGHGFSAWNGNSGDNHHRRKSWSEELVDDYEDDDDEEPTAVATAIIVVRYFHRRLLGVTCGRLTSVYERTARMALHRHLHGRDVPFVERFAFDSILREGSMNRHKNLYALGAGDTELILNVVGGKPPPPEEEDDDSSSTDNSSSTDTTTKSNTAGNTGSGDNGVSSRNDIVQGLMDELKFEHMVGSKNERLPRLQNLQADFPITTTTGTPSDVIMPVYRYPGNYSGTEWPTHPWSKTTLAIKQIVEQALRPLYDQHMNHCVTNLYRNGCDRIDHHSDKDLDLNRSGVIVSVSLGSTRVMELRDKMYPHDTARVELPPYSMFVLGPYTNARFTHAILPSEREINFDVEVDEEENNHGEVSTKFNDVNCNIERGGRISLTFRDVRTFLDVKTQRLFGQGVDSNSLIEVGNDGNLCKDTLSKAVEYTRHQDWKDKCSATAIAVGIGSTAGYVSSNKSRGMATESDTLSLLKSVSTMMISASAVYCYLRHARSMTRRLREEKEARTFFSKASATGNKY